MAGTEDETLLKLGCVERSLNRDAIKDNERILVPCDEGLNNPLFSLYVRASQDKYTFKYRDEAWVFVPKNPAEMAWYERHKEGINAYIADVYDTGKVFRFCVHDYDMWQNDPAQRMGIAHPRYTPYVLSYNTLTVGDTPMHALPAKEMLHLFDEQRDKTVFPSKVQILTINDLTYGEHVDAINMKFKADIAACTEIPGNDLHFIVLRAIDKRDTVHFKKEEGKVWMLQDWTEDVVDFSLAKCLKEDDMFGFRVCAFLDTVKHDMVRSPFVNLSPDGNDILISLFYLGIVVKHPEFNSMQLINQSLCLNPTSVSYFALENVKLIRALFSLG